MDCGPLATGQQFKTQSDQSTNPGSVEKSKDWEIHSVHEFSTKLTSETTS